MIPSSIHLFTKRGKNKELEKQCKESDSRYLEEKELREESDAKFQALMRRIKELEEIAQRTNSQTITNSSIQINGITNPFLQQRMEE